MHPAAQTRDKKNRSIHFAARNVVNQSFMCATDANKKILFFLKERARDCAPVLLK